MSFWDTKVRNIGGWTMKILEPQTLPSRFLCALRAYRARNVTGRTAGVKPLVHYIAAVVFVSYLIEFKHLRKHSMLRKYH